MTQKEQIKAFEQALDDAWKRYEESGAATVDALEENTQKLAFAKGYNAGYKQSVEHPTGGELLYVLNKGHEQGYKDAIKDACKLLARMVWEVTYEDLDYNSTHHYDKVEFIEDFKKAMRDLENIYTTESQEDFFKDAKFGDKFIDNEGKTYIYHYMEKYKASDGKIWDYHYLIREPAVYNDYPDLGEIKYHPYEAYVFKDGFGIPSHLKYYSVKSMKDGPNNDYFIIRKLNNE